MKRLLLLAIAVFLISNVFAQTTYYWVGGNTAAGNFSTASNWNTVKGSTAVGTRPSAAISGTTYSADNFIFDYTDVGAGVTGTSITITAGFGAYTLGGIQVAGGNNFSVKISQGGAVVLNNNLIVNASNSLEFVAATFTFGGSFSPTVNGTLIFGAQGTTTTFNIGTDWTANSATGTIAYNYSYPGGNCRIIPATYYHLDADYGTGVNRNFGTLNTSQQNFVIKGNFYYTANTNNVQTTVFTFSGADQTIAPTSFYGLVIGGTGVKTISRTGSTGNTINTLAISTSATNAVSGFGLTINSGAVLDLGDFLLTGTVISNSGEVRAASAASLPTPGSLPWGGLVTYNGTATQSIPATSFTDLKITGAKSSSVAFTGSYTSGSAILTNLSSITGLMGLTGGTITGPSGIGASTTNTIASVTRGATIKGNTTSGQAYIATMNTVGLVAGMTLSGTGINSGTTISSISAPVNIASVTSASGNATLTTATTTGVVVGMYVIGTGNAAIPSGTGITVISISPGASITLSSPATGVATTGISFSGLITISNNATSTSTGTTVTCSPIITMGSSASATASTQNLTLPTTLTFSGATNVAGNMTVDYTGSYGSIVNTSATLTFNGSTANQTLSVSNNTLPLRILNISTTGGFSTSLASGTVTTSGLLTVGANFTQSVNSTITESGGITVNTGVTYTVNASGLSAAASSTANSSNAVLNVAASTTVTLTGTGKIDVYGYLNNATTTAFSGASASTLQFRQYAVYQYGGASGSLPLATWDANSNVYITGTTSGLTIGTGQAFGNFIFNCTGLTTNVALNAASNDGNSVAGQLVILNTGAGTNTFRIYNAGTTTATTVAGGIQVGGSYTFGGSTLTATNTTFDLGANIAGSPSTSTTNVTVGSNGIMQSSSATILNISSSLSVTGAFTNTNTTINFNGTGAQTIPALNYNSLTISGARTSNNVALASSGTVGIAGTFTYSATFTSGSLVNTGSTISFNGTGAQTIPAFNYNNLTLTGARTTNNVTLASSGTIGVAGVLDATGLSFGTGSLVTTTSTVNFNNATGGQTIPVLPTTYVNLIIGNTSGTQVAGGNLTVTTLDITNAGAVLNMSTNTLSGSSLTTSGNGTLQTANTSTTPIPAGRTYNFLVEYTVTGGGQTIPGTGTTIFNNGLKCDNTSGVDTTVGGNITINGKLQVPSGGNFAISDAYKITTPTSTTLAATWSVGGNTLTCTTTGLSVGMVVSGVGISTGATITTVNGGSVVISPNTINGTTGGTVNFTTFDGTAMLGNLHINSNNSTASSYSFPINATWGTGSTVTYQQNSNNRIIPATYYNLIPDSTFNGASSTLSLDNVTNSTALFIFNGNITMLHGSSVSGTNYRNTTVVFNGTSQTIPAWSFYNLTLGTNSTFTTGQITINNVLNTGSTTSTSQGTINFNSTAAQDIPAFNYNNLTISGTRAGSPIITLASGTIGVGGTFSVTATGIGSYTNTGNTFDFTSASSQSVPAFNYNNLSSSGNGARTLASSGTIGIAGVYTPTTGTRTITGSTIDFNGTGSQTVNAITYNNLAISGTRTGSPTITVASGTIAVGGTFSVTATGIGSYINTNNTFNFTSASSQTIPAFNYNNLSSSGNGARTLASSGTIGIAGTYTPTSGTRTITGSTIDFNGTGSQTVNATTYHNLSISGSGTKTLVGNTVLGGGLTVSSILDASTYTITPAASTVTISGTFKTTNTNGFSGSASTAISSVNSPSYTLTGSTIEYMAGTAQTVSSRSDYNNLTISGGSTKTMAATVTVGGALKLSSSSDKLSIGADTLKLNGTVDAASVGFITGGTSSNLTIGSTTTVGTLLFDQTSATTSTLKNITLNGSGGTTTLGNALNLTGILTPTSGTLASGGYLTLKSTSITNSAIVAQGNGTVTGDVTAERFIPTSSNGVAQGRRAFRDLSPGVITTQSVYQAWQESGSNSNGYGTQITGVKGTPGQTDVTTGLDYTISGSKSMYSYNINTATGAATWDAITDTKNTIPSPFKGYRLLVRGDRANNLGADASLLTSAATLRPKGQLISGTVLYRGDTVTANGVTYTAKTNNLTSNVAMGHDVADAFTMIGNPYISPIDWVSIANNNSAAVKPSIYIWDPNIGTTGAYVTYNSSTGSSNGGSQVNQYIQPGQAFFIQRNGSATPQFQIRDVDKSPSQSNLTNVFGEGNTMPLSKIRFTLLKTISGSQVNMDGAVMCYRPDFSNEIGREDAQKIDNSSECLAINSHAKLYSIEGRATAAASDSIGLKLYYTTNNANYQLNVDLTGFTSNGSLQPYLKDRFTKTITPLTLGTQNMYGFVTTTDTSSYNNRFTVVFGGNTVLPIGFTSVKAYSNTNTNSTSPSNTIEWTANEAAADYYEVEHSSNVQVFASIGRQTASGNGLNSYSYSHQYGIAGNNYYRIKGMDKSGRISYSATVLVNNSNSGNRAASVSVYPNPIANGVANVHFSNMVAGSYAVTIHNIAGQTVYQGSMAHNGQATASYALGLPNKLAQGVYSLTVGNGSSQFKQQLIVK